MIDQLTGGMTADAFTRTHSPTLRDPRKGVKVMALFESRRARKRAWDELSEADKAVLLESVRQRRQRAQDDAARLSALHGLRNLR